jgi:Ca2+-transporting ATPase
LERRRKHFYWLWRYSCNHAAKGFSRIVKINFGCSFCEIFSILLVKVFILVLIALRVENMKFYQNTVDQVAQFLQVDLQKGLSVGEVESSRKTNGTNSLPQPQQESFIKIFFSQFCNPLIYVLIAAAAIILVVGETLDAFIISGVLLFNATLGAVQEGRTASILKKLRQMLKTQVVVVRGGKREIISEHEVVAGDVIFLQQGDQVPADARLFEAYDLKVDEAILTGESSAAKKNCDTLTKDMSLGDRANMIYQGTYVLTGQAKAVVVSTAQNTEIGKLNKIIEKIDSQTKLQKDLDKLSYWILIFIVVTCAALFVVGFATGKSASELLVMLTALFICVVPEGLPVILTLILATGAHRMAKQNVLIKRLRAIESLGRVDTLIMDKTGTLTHNALTVKQVYTDGQKFTVSGSGYLAQGGKILLNGIEYSVAQGSPLCLLGMASGLLSDALLSITGKKVQIKGEPIEAAMVVFSQKLGFVKSKFRQEHLLPFNLEKMFKAGVFAHGAEKYLFVSGTPEFILQHASGVDNAKAALDNMIAKKLRMVGVAYLKLDKTGFDIANFDNHFKKIKFLGWLGMQDDVRSDIKAAAAKITKMDIKLVIATGDHQETATYVAEEAGLINKNLEIFARVSPQEKFDLVKKYQAEGRSVAMIGDGINDAPSLAVANVGIAMGEGGTEVAKSAADIILLKDTFSSVVSAIEQGRHIFYTLRRVFLYFFATNLGEVLVILCALFLALPIPILPAQILWLNLVTDGFLDMALAMEAVDLDKIYNDKKPAQLIDRNMAYKILYMATMMGVGTIVIFLMYYQKDLAKARTMTLITMAMFQWFNAWNCRSEEKSTYTLGMFSNRWLLLAMVSVFSLQFLVVYAPFMQSIFKTVPITGSEWMLAFVVSSSMLIAEEIRKFIVIRFVK